MEVKSSNLESVKLVYPSTNGQEADKMEDIVILFSLGPKDAIVDVIVRYRVNLLWIEFEECLPRKGVVHSSNLGMDDWAQDIWEIRTQQSIWWILTQSTTYVQVWVTWSEFESVSPFIPASKDPQNSFNSYSREPLKTFRSESRRAPARLVQGKLQNLGCSSAQRGWPGSRRRCWSPAAEFSHYWTSRHPASHSMTPLVLAPDRARRL